MMCRTKLRRGLRSVVITSAALGGAAAPVALGQAAGAPNIVVINIDDMGFADLAPYNTDAIQADTPTATRLASEGLKFNNYYSGSPICSASRAALLTGQYSGRWGINAFIDNRANNKARDTRDFLSLEAPMIPRALRDGAGYATANVGKWHLGGGRDVGYNLAPVVTEYGFDQSLTQFEGLGDRVLYQNLAGTALEGLSQSSKNLGTRGGQDTIYEIQRDQSSAFFVDRAIQFVQQTKAATPDKPFFINLAFDDVHTPYDPKPDLLAKYQQRYPSLDPTVQQYLAVMENLDTQIGRFVDAIDSAGLGDETLILLTADNGPSGPTYNTGSAGGLRGSKGSLYEGGIKEPLIARWTGRIGAGQVNSTTVVHATDLFPSLTAIAGLPGAGATASTDGQDMSAALLGDAQPLRGGTLFWDYGRNSMAAGPAPGAVNHSPNLALRQGNYKFLIDADGTKAALYDLSVDPNETTNLVAQQPGRVHAMARQALAMRYEMPSIIPPENVTNMMVHLRAENLTLANGAAVSSFIDADSGDAFNGNLAQGTTGRQPTLVHNAINGRKSLRFDGDDYLASSQTNRLPNPGRGLTIFMVATGDQSGDRAARAAQVGAAAGTNGQVVGADLSDGETGFRFNNGAAVYDASFDPDDFHIFVFQIDHQASYASAKLFIDGTVDANTFTGLASAAGTTNFGEDTLELLLGTGRLNTGAIAGSDYFLGDIAELLVYNEQMTELEINLVANYLSSEYALPFAYDTGSAVPEPATVLVAIPALLGVLGMRRRRSR
jgi:arylsulfatase A-like enzyme